MMRNKFLFSVLAFSSLSLYAISAIADISSTADDNLLQENFSVYTSGSAVINHPMTGATQKILPTKNDFKQNPGCYIACYSHDSAAAIYGVGSDIYVMGQLRVPGSYKGRICLPTGYENKDISKEVIFASKCSSLIAGCKNSKCWAGGDTGGWFGIQ